MVLTPIGYKNCKCTDILPKGTPFPIILGLVASTFGEHVTVEAGTTENDFNVASTFDEHATGKYGATENDFNFASIFHEHIPR